MQQFERFLRRTVPLVPKKLNVTSYMQHLKYFFQVVSLSIFPPTIPVRNVCSYFTCTFWRSLSPSDRVPVSCCYHVRATLPAVNARSWWIFISSPPLSVSAVFQPVSAAVARWLDHTTWKQKRWLVDVTSYNHYLQRACLFCLCVCVI